MSQIQIVGRTSPASCVLDDILHRKPSVTFSVPEHLTLESSEQAVRQFHMLLWQEANTQPLKLAQVLSCVQDAEVLWKPLDRVVTVKLTYFQQLRSLCEDLDFMALCPTERDVCEYLRDAMLLRKQNILLLYPHDRQEHLSSTNYLRWVETTRKKDAFNDQKYLERNIKNYKKSEWQYFLGFYLFHYSIEYRTTYEQEQVLYRAVDAAIEQMNLHSAAVFDKIRLVYHYMVRNIRYDYDYQRYTAYHAMIEHCACCQGYALLFYLFMRKLGVPVEYISGVTADGEHHGWNLVKCGAYWYNIDTTWEQLYKGKNISIVKQNYLLKSDQDFQDHIPNESYQTEAFRLTHPMAKQSI